MDRKGKLHMDENLMKMTTAEFVQMKSQKIAEDYAKILRAELLAAAKEGRKPKSERVIMMEMAESGKYGYGSREAIYKAVKEAMPDNVHLR